MGYASQFEEMRSSSRRRMGVSEQHQCRYCPARFGVSAEDPVTRGGARGCYGRGRAARV